MFKLMYKYSYKAAVYMKTFKFFAKMLELCTLLPVFEMTFFTVPIWNICHI